MPASSQPGTFLATPVTAGAAVNPGETLTFTLTGIVVSPGPRLAVIQIGESADGAAASVPLAVEIFSPPPA